MDTISIRPGRLDDVAVVADIRNALWQGLAGHPVAAPDQIHLEWQTSGFDIARRVGLAVDARGEIAGYVWLTSLGARSVRMVLAVRDGEGSRAAREALLDWGEARGREVAADDAADGPLTVYVSVAPGDAGTTAALEDRGYSLYRVSLEMRIGLDAPPPPQWPAGVTLRSLCADGMDSAVHAALSAAFETNWEGDRVPPFETWRSETLADVGYDPGLWVVAVADGGKVAGAIGGTRFWRGQVGVGGLFDFGVRPAWRGQRLGRAILLQALRQFHKRGYRTAALRVDAHNAPAVHLYESVGMRCAWRLPTYTREILPD
ncbi:MAG: GNAT family N-acetyltransferase [Anaerolineae bacterium]